MDFTREIQGLLDILEEGLKELITKRKEIPLESASTIIDL